MRLHFDWFAKQFHCIKTDKSNKPYRIKHVWVNIALFWGGSSVDSLVCLLTGLFRWTQEHCISNLIQWNEMRKHRRTTAKKNHTLTKRNYDTFLIRTNSVFSVVNAFTLPYALLYTQSNQIVWRKWKHKNIFIASNNFGSTLLYVCFPMTIPYTCAIVLLLVV